MADKKKKSTKAVTKAAGKKSAGKSTKAAGKPAGKSGLAGAEGKLRAMAMALPEVREDFPWGHSAFKVGAKAFAFMSMDGGHLSLSVKLPESAEFALMQPYAEPTGYGLGKSGWVTSSFTKAGEVPLDLLRMWMAESYRAIAPKKLAAKLAPRA